MRTKSFATTTGTFLDKLLQNLRLFRIKRYIRKGATVCDFGCGYEAVMLNNIKDIIKNGVGLDLEVSLTYSSSKISLQEADLNKPLALEDNYFDVVTSLANLEHLDNRELALSEMYRILKPGGILLMTVPSIYSKPVLEFMAYKLHIINEPEIRDHKTYFNKESISLLFKKAGFRQIKHQYFQLFMNNFVYAEK